jgi:hypothetical protein
LGEGFGLDLIADPNAGISPDTLIVVPITAAGLPMAVRTTAITRTIVIVSGWRAIVRTSSGPDNGARCETTEKTGGKSIAPCLSGSSHRQDGAGREHAMKNASHDKIPSNIPVLTMYSVFVENVW